MKVRVLAAIPCMLTILWSATVQADVLVLRDGRKLNGILSNSASIQSDPAAFHEISFLVGTGRDAVLQRFNTSEIEWILIESSGPPAVVDFAPFSATRPAIPLMVAEPKPRTTLHLDVKGGVSWARFNGNGSSEFHEFRNGRTFGASLTMLRGNRGGASVGAFYVQKGARGKTSTYAGHVATLEYRMDYIEIPAVVVLRVPIQNAAIRLLAGPTVALRVSSESVGEGWAFFNAPELDGKIDLTDATAPMDIGLKFGLGLELRLNRNTALLLEGSYDPSITTFAENSVFTRWTHGVTTAEVGLSFALTRDDHDDFPSRWERR